MKYNGKNIVFDDDVTMTGSNLGEKLSDVVGELQSKTSKLESYMKWIYKYGGVGGSGGSGSGDTDYILYATLNGVQINSQNIILSAPGSYELKFIIQKPLGATFNVVYNYTTINGSGVTVSQGESLQLNISNSYTYTKYITLNNNDTITVSATDSIYGVTKQVSAYYVTRSYQFDTMIGNNSKEGIGTEVFITTANSKGLNVFMDYEIAVAASTSYKLSFNVGDRILTTSGVIPSNNKSGTLTIDLLNLASINGITFTNSSAGYYSVVLDITIQIEGQLSQNISRPMNFSLIPDGLYLLVQPTVGTIYTSEQAEDTEVYQYNAGFVTFSVKAYYGTNSDSSCTINYYLDGDTTNPISLISTLRKSETAKVYTTVPGLNKVLFKLTSNNVNYPSDGGYYTYYFYVKEPDKTLTWPWDISYSTSREGTLNYYRGGVDFGGSTSSGGVKSFQDFYNVTGGNPFVQSSSKDELVITNIYAPDSSKTEYNTVITLGIQYSEINSDVYDPDSNPDGSIIFTGLANNSTKITVTQSSVRIGSYINISYYLPKTIQSNFSEENLGQYHLLSIVSRYIKTVGTDSYYEVLVYVDGVIEGAASDYMSNNTLSLDKLVLKKSNFILNLVDVSYPNPTYRSETINSITKTYSIPEDVYMYQYYLKYRDVVLSDKTISTNDKDLISYGSSFQVDNDGTVTCTLDTVGNVATRLSVPTMVAVINDDDGTVMSRLNYENGGESYSVSEDVTVMWSEGNGELLTDISFPTSPSYPNAQFNLSIQGSSTRNYKCKNYTLALQNKNTSENAPVYLYSPNYDPDDPNTFLPEESFTLKADVVDSSHSNNTSVGKFVNEVTTKFATGSTGALSGFTKNCLQGFPIVMYLAIVTTDPTTKEKSTKCYYQGVYNFNLGRESFYNLGYKDSSVISTSLLQQVKNGFSFYYLDKANDKMKDGLIISEIQGNSPYFDFSQDDETILYNTYNVAEETYMFGDFVTGSNISESQAKIIIKKLVGKVSLAGGYLFGPNILRKKFGDNDLDNHGYISGYNATKTITKDNGDGTTSEVVVPSNQVPNYRYSYKKTIDNGGALLYSTSNSAENLKSEGQVSDLLNLVGDETDQRPGWLDFQSLSEYYTICMTFGLVDSVQKNMNLKTWTGDPDSGYGKFYTAFYDMDTCLGINNAGTDVSYFAFSDYWSYDESDVSEDGSIIKPSSVTIYRDYSPKSGTDLNGSDYYDTPSSYLFAVAKYAKYVSSTGYNDIIGNWPKKLWAKWRTDTTIVSDPSVGCLSSADKFMSNYFSNNLGKVSIPLINMNYRNKYLIKSSLDSNSFLPLDFQKFNGTRVAKATEWLRGRIHILDAYFNLPNARSNIQYYDETGNYVNVTTVSETGSISYMMEPDVKDYNLSNTDIIVNQDIFAGDSTNQGNTTINVNIKSKKFSPLFVTTANDSFRYLLGGGDAIYNLVVKLNGTQTYTLGGSGAWTSLDSINTFSFDNLYINTKYLETLNGDSKRALTVNGANIVMPSLKDLSLTGSNYTQNFTGAAAITGTKFPNLKSVNVSGTATTIEINQSTCNSVNISSMKSGSVNISSCSYLNAITLGTGSSSSPCTTLSKLYITPVPITLCTTSSTDNTSGGFTVDYAAIGSVTVSNLSNTGNGSSRFSYTNDNVVTDITIQGFAQVRIENCPKLRTIYITEPEVSNGVISGDNLEQIYIDNCGSSADLFKIGSSESANNVAELTTYSHLKSCRISRVYKMTEVHFNEGSNYEVNILGQGFYSDTALKYLSGHKINLTSNYIFSQCPAYTLRSKADDGGIVSITPLYIPSTTTNLTGMFQSTLGGSIDLVAAKSFIEGSGFWGNKSLVTAIDSMFHGQVISYSETDLKNDIAGRTSNYIDMTGFTRVTTATSCFAWNPITAWHRKMISVGMGVGVTSLNIDNYFRVGTTTITTTMDLLTDIINKVTILWWNSYPSDDYPILKFIDTGGNTLTNVSLVNFFHPGGKHPSNVTSLRYMSFSSLHTTIDFTNVFDTNWTKLGVLYRFLYDRDYTNLTGLDTLLNKLAALYSVVDSIRIINPDKPVNLFTFCNWVKLLSNTTSDIFTARWDTYTSYDLGCFNISKYLTDTDYITLTGLLYTSRLKGFSYIFKNCTLYSSNGTTLGIAPSCSSALVSNSMFDGFKIVSVPSGTVEADITAPASTIRNAEDAYVTLGTIFSNLPNITDTAFMFRGMKIANAISYDFFAKRREVTTPNVYVVKSGMTLPDGITYYTVADYSTYFSKGTLYKYTYNRTLKNIESCFLNVKWKQDDSTLENARCFTPPTNMPSQNRIILDDTTVITDGTTIYYTVKTYNSTTIDGNGNAVITPISYYGNTGQIVLGTENSELTDLAWMDYTGTIQKSEHIQSFTYSGFTFTNFYIKPGDENKLFVAPDIFYGCTSGCSIISFFSNDQNSDETLEGVIPTNLLKNCKSVPITNVFNNLNITPRYYWTITTDTIEEDVYYYVPRSFTDYSTLSNSFNFHLQIPASESIIESTGKSTFSSYYLFLSDSLNSGNVSTLSNSLPSVSYVNAAGTAGLHINYPSFGVTTGGTLPKNFKIHYNVMYTPTVFVVGGVTVYTGTDGIDMTKYSKLQLDNLISANLGCFLYGSLFNSSFYLNNMKKASSNNYVFNVFLTGTNNSNISINCILPQSSVKDLSNLKFFYFDASVMYVGLSQITNGNNISSTNALAYASMRCNSEPVNVAANL